MSKSFLFLFCFVLQCIDSARILAVFPAVSISHQVVFRPLTQKLARRGHEVVVVTTDPVFPKGQSPKNLTEIDVHDVSYSIWNKVLFEMAEKQTDFLKRPDLIINFIYLIFEEQVKSKNIQELLSLKDDYFDLLLLEASVRPVLGFSYYFKAPVIQISSFGAVLDNHHVMGTPWHPFLYPSTFRDRIYNLRFWEKIKQLFIELYLLFAVQDQEMDNKLLRKLFGPDIPPIHQLSNNIGMLFLNVHPIWENNRPVPPGVIYLGGLHQNPEKKLPEDLNSYLDSSKNGVIYFSLGTNVKPSSVSPEKLETIIKVFSRLPYDVLWKWDNDQLPGRSTNIKISKWLPQSDLLRHPKIKVFITQGGLQSTDEAITAGVPLIGIPMFADQWYNVEQYVHHRIGLRLDIETLTEEKFETAIKTILNDKSYRDNIVKLRSVMQDQPESPLERAVWWTEHVLRHGDARYFRCPAANVSWTQYLKLELLFVLTSVLIFFFTVLYLVFKTIYNYFTFKEPATLKIKKS